MTNMLQFTTKADTLRALYGQLKAAEVLPQVCLTAGEAEKDPGQILSMLRRNGLLGKTLIVRSSAKNEDMAECSNAGKFLSIPDVKSEEDILYGLSCSTTCRISAIICSNTSGDWR